MAPRQAVLGMENASFYYGASRVFEGVSFLLDDARTALVGENGAGKSTLLKCLTGALELNGGQVIRSRGLRVGSLPQDMPPGLAERSVREVLADALERAGHGGEDWRIDVLLDEIGVEPEIADTPFGTLSGGWQRLMLIAAAARLEEPDLLILDEPTNHLDLANINTLERWLTVDFKVPMLIVSHDRECLDRVTERTLFLRSDGVHAFKTRFSVAREELLRRDATAAARARLEDKEIKRLEQAAARYKVWAVKNPDLNKRKNAVETRIARIEAERTATYTTRERRLELSRRRDRRPGGAAHRRPRRHGPGRRGAGSSPSTAWSSPPATGWRCWARTARASRPCCRRSPPPTIRNWSTTTARRRSASTRPAGWSISTSRCATCRWR